MLQSGLRLCSPLYLKLHTSFARQRNNFYYIHSCTGSHFISGTKIMSRLVQYIHSCPLISLSHQISLSLSLCTAPPPSLFYRKNPIPLSPFSTPREQARKLLSPPQQTTNQTRPCLNLIKTFYPRVNQ